jgi:hypothetical protein
VSDLFILLKRLCVYDYDYVAEAHAVGERPYQTIFHFRQAQKCFSFSFRKNTESAKHPQKYTNNKTYMGKLKGLYKRMLCTSSLLAKGCWPTKTVRQ